VEISTAHAVRPTDAVETTAVPGLSNSQIERLGLRLAREPTPTEEDLALLHRLLADRAAVLAETVDLVRAELSVTPTARVKNTGTIVEKLRRSGGSRLKNMQDLAGMRIVGAFDRDGQDELVAQLVDLFRGAPRTPRVVDRRAEPVSGYRAVHVIVFPHGTPVEVQVRTRWQHEWAEVFEKLADRIGRGIRYGEPPTRWRTQEQLDAEDPMLRRLFDVSYNMRDLMVGQARAVADFLSAVDEAELTASKDEPTLVSFRSRADAALAAWRSTIQEFLDETVPLMDTEVDPG